MIFFNLFLYLVLFVIINFKVFEFLEIVFLVVFKILVKEEFTNKNFSWCCVCILYLEFINCLF